MDFANELRVPGRLGVPYPCGVDSSPFIWVVRWAGIIDYLIWKALQKGGVARRDERLGKCAKADNRATRKRRIAEMPHLQALDSRSSRTLVKGSAITVTYLTN